LLRGFGSVRFGLVWFGLVWFGLVWFGLVWFGLVWFGLVCILFSFILRRINEKDKEKDSRKEK
jgi:hypothetical protein